MENKRLRYFDIARGIGIILVLIGHLQGEILNFSPYIVYLCIWIFSFHMPLFFIISGMLVKYKGDREKDLKLLIRRRFKGIMIPYYLFSIIYIGIVLYALLISKTIQANTLFVNLWYVLGLYGMNVLWFLPALFLGEVLFLFLIKSFDGKKAPIILLVLTGIGYIINVFLQGQSYDTDLLNRLHELCITLLRPVFVASFIGIGYYAFDLVEGIKTKKGQILISQLCLIIDIISIYVSMKLLNYTNVGDFRSLVQHNIIVYYVAAVSGSLWLILISKLLSETGLKLRLLTFYGMNSLIFMAVHNNSSVLTLALKTAMYVNQYLTRARGYICYLIVILVMLTYTTLTVYLVNRFFPFMAGKSMKRTGKGA
ncbi:MAG: acyltransferase family protein [Lachnospiraceae bacterium]|nr:acyltransferase family protein [Lachnospiraceae bacterium]